MLRVLLVEDSTEDAELIERQLLAERAQTHTRTVQTRDEFLEALTDSEWDIVVADYSLPQFGALEVLEILAERESDLPVILITGTLSEELAVEFIKKGGEDFILKSSLKRLGLAIIKAVERRCVERDRCRTQAALKRSHGQLRALTAKLQSLRESERIRIAREIHDELGQGLTAIKIELSRIADKLGARRDPLAPKLQAAVDLTNTTIQSVQRIVTELKPRLLDELGLAEAIRWQVEEFQKRTGIPCRLLNRATFRSFSGEMSTSIFRILQESLTNVARHARATQVDISLRTLSGRLHLAVRDNGCGIRTHELETAGSLGIVGMRERALLLGGCFDIRGLAGAGTQVTVTMPLGRKAASSYKA